jgi:m7GpppX diphosphatase
LTKTINLLGVIFDKPAVLTFEKTAWDTAQDFLERLIVPGGTGRLDVVQRNDIYRWYLADLLEKSAGVKATLIYPATDKHIRKYEKQRKHMVKETPEIYNKLVEPYIQTVKGSRIQWYVLILPNLRKVVQCY